MKRMLAFLMALMLLPLGAVAELFTAYLKMDDYKWVYQMQPNE